MKTGKVVFAEAEDIEVEEGFNVRFDYGDIQELGLSIIENGLRVPLRGVKRGDKYVLTDGHRRFKAIKWVLSQGYALSVPIILEEDLTDTDKVLTLLTCNEGKRLNLLEESEVYQRLKSLGYTTKDVAKKVGKSPSYVAGVLLLQTISPYVRNKIIEGFVAPSFVIEQLHKYTPEEVTQLIKELSPTGRITRTSIKRNRSLKRLYKDLQEVEAVNNVKMLTLQKVLQYQKGDITEEELISYITY